MTEKIKPKVGSPPLKNRLNAHNMYSMIIFAILWCYTAKHIRTMQWYKIIFIQLLATHGRSFAFQKSHENAAEHQMNAYCEIWIIPIFATWGNLRLHFLSQFLFNFENISAHKLRKKINKNYFLPPLRIFALK